MAKAAVADYDNDGLVDLYLANSGVAGEGQPRWVGDRSGPTGVLLKNLGEFRFLDVTSEAQAGGGHREVLGAAWTDIEPDGDPDLVLVNHMGENVLLRNRGDGVFDEEPWADGFGGFSMGLDVGDLDEDGDPDLYVANMSSRAGLRITQNLPANLPGNLARLMNGWINGNEILRNTGSRFELVRKDTAGWAYGPVLFDIDGDGRLDVYCPTGYQRGDMREPDG